MAGATAKKQNTGRKPIELDDNSIVNLASIGCTNEEIAASLGVSADTLSRRFAEAIKKGKLQMQVSLRRIQMRSANGFVDPDGKYIPPSIPMQIWLGKQYLGQSDQPAQAQDDHETSFKGFDEN